MKTVHYLMSVFYFWSKRSVAGAPPYLATVLCFSLLAWMDLASLGAALGFHQLFTSGWLSFVTVFGLLPAVFYTVGNRASLERASYPEVKLRSGRKWILLWLAFSIALAIVCKIYFIPAV